MTAVAGEPTANPISLTESMVMIATRFRPAAISMVTWALTLPLTIFLTTPLSWFAGADFHVRLRPHYNLL